MQHNKIIIAFFLFALISMLLMFKLLPSEAMPREDRGLIGISVPAMAGKGIDSAEANTNIVEDIVKNIPETLGCLSFTQEWGGTVILPLKPIEQRSRSAEEIVNSLRPQLTSFPSFDAWPWTFSNGLPGIEISESSELGLIISTVDSYRDLFKAASEVRQKGNDEQLFKSLSHNLRLDNLGYNIDLDYRILADLNISKTQVAKIISIFFSGDSSLNFKKDGILYPITIKGDVDPWTIDELYVTNPKGKRISVGSFATLTAKAEPKELEHYNQMRAVKLSATLSNEDNIEDSMQKLYNLADEILPKSYQKTWTGLAKNYNDTTATMSMLFLLSLLFIYAILAVQFESFIDPLIILFTVPLACFGSLLVLYLSHGSLNIYSQVGLITLIGLITKHGILIVEFANQLRSQGANLLEAIEQSASLRLRPILMTTGTMICGSIPLVLSSSSGSEARNSIGIILVAGLSIGTIFTLFVLPSIYYMIKDLEAKFKK